MLGIQVGTPVSTDDAPGEVWAEHWPAVSLFLGVQTQWRIAAGMGGLFYQGLEYPAIYGHPAFTTLDPDTQQTRLEQLQLIEAGALEVLNRR
ncbi:DUF1799 domain-containing protein [Terasakiispira papahanaumokuakeensis]|uniref:DUF1799 domain-containing protein n=1 Tax=Terasakiispira papahanaumokuakeensis TaxID=197479 RepID=UPI0015860CBF|nr:DUF1799 domain-containing protein [Terasakiispira papahanaumokuakeensis]